MAPDSLTPAETGVQPADLFGPITAEIERLEQQGKFLRAEADQILAAAQKQADQKRKEAAAADQQVVTIRARLATLGGAKVETVAGLVVGQLYEGRGIYMGQVQPKTRKGKSIGKTYNLFAAKDDVKQGAHNLLLTFNDMVKEVASIRGLHGHDGALVANDTALIKGLEDRSLEGKWMIPSFEWLLGKDISYNDTQDPNLFALRDTGAFKNGFVTKPSGSDNSSWYWSLSEHRDLQSFVLAARFSDGDLNWHVKDLDRLSCRLCRVELAL